MKNEKRMTKNWKRDWFKIEREAAYNRIRGDGVEKKEKRTLGGLEE